MQTKQKKYVTECQKVHQTKGETVLEFINKFANLILITSNYIQFNGQVRNNQKNSISNKVIFTPDGMYAVIFVIDPQAVLILNLTNGELMTAWGLDEIKGMRIIAVSMQPQQENKANRKLYLIYEHRGSIYLKIVQIQGNSDNLPKSKLKVIQQNLSNNIESTPPVFGALTYNYFILCRRSGLRVCKSIFKAQQLNLFMISQNLQRGFQQIISNYIVLAIIQSHQTFALLCGNNFINTHQNKNIKLYVFWQHQQKTEQMKNIYFRDDSYIKSVQLPYFQREYVKMWNTNGNYIIETIKFQTKAHQCHIIPQSTNQGYVTLRMSERSEVCLHSLKVGGNQIQLCQVANKTTINKIKYYYKQIAIQQTTASTNATVSQNRQTTTTVQQNNNPIRRFQVVSETHQNQQIDDGKKTTKKSQIQTKNDPINTLINKKIVEHLTKKDEASDQQVPSKIQSVVSFGTPGTGVKPKQNKTPSNTLISFGQPNKPTSNQVVFPPPASFGIQSQNAPKPTINQKVQTRQQQSPIIKKIEKEYISLEKSKQIKIHLSQMVSKFCFDLDEMEKFIKNNYSGRVQKISYFRQIFTSEQAKVLKQCQTKIKEFSFSISIQKSKQIEMKKQIETKYKKVSNKIETCLKVLAAIQLSPYENIPQFQSLKLINKNNRLKINRKFDSKINFILNQSKIRIQELEQTISNMRIQKQINSANHHKKKLRLRQITQGLYLPHFSNTSKTPKKQQKIPICREIMIGKMSPLVELTPL